MKILLVCLSFCVVASFASSSKFSLQEIQEFEKFEKDFRRNYVTRSDRSLRMKIFVQNLRDIQAHNSNPKRNYNKGINQFADMTDKEFREGYLGYRKVPGLVNGVTARKTKEEDQDFSKLPENVDWREKGAIGVIRNQGSCGSCWAFSSMENIESYVFIETGVLPTLSPQQITSCSVNPYHCGGQGGCNGAISQVGYMYTQLYGLSMEEDYPYLSGMTENTEECTFDAKSEKPLARIRGYETLPSNDIYAVMKHLAEVGPLSVNVDSTNFRFYANGMLDGCDFDENININHVVQLIGYGTDSEQGPYWLIRNSWGTTWGDEGILKLRRYPETRCGLDSTPLNGTGCVYDGNDIQKVCGNCGIIFDTSYPIGASIQSEFE